MSNHLVEPPPKGWGDWKEFVGESGVQLTHKQLQLGEMLIGRSEPPSNKARVVHVYDYCSVSTVGGLLQRPFFNYSEPIHPMLLLSLAAGVQGAADSTIFDHMQYEMAMSPFLLADSAGTNFIFLLKNDRQRFYGEFRALDAGDYLPRCTHVWGYSPEREPGDDHLMFRKRADGKYGPHYSESGRVLVG